MVVQGWQVLLPELPLREAFETGESLGARVAWHYSMPLVRACYHLLASLEILGNPSALIDDLRGGLRHIIACPAALIAGDTHGAASNLARGAAGLVGGPSAFALDFLSGLNHRCVQAATGYSFDTKYANKIEAASQEHARTAKQGIKMGGQIAYQAMLRGVERAVSGPAQGVQKRSPVVFCRGLGVGALELVSIPVAGFLVAVSKVMQGGAAEVRRHTPEGQAREARQRILRVRQPRAIDANGVLLPYPKGKQLASRRMERGDESSGAAEGQTGETHGSMDGEFGLRCHSSE